MAWSFSFSGKRAEAIKELQRYSNQLSGRSKTEFDAASPFLAGLINQTAPCDGQIKIQASGQREIRSMEMRIIDNC